MEPPAGNYLWFRAIANALNEWGYTLKPTDEEKLFNDAQGDGDDFVDLILTAEGFDPATVSPKTKRELLTYVGGGPGSTWNSSSG